MGHNVKCSVNYGKIPCGLAVGIPGFYSSGPGSTPDAGTFLDLSDSIYYTFIHSGYPQRGLN